jgi:hypothetical protein
MPAAAGSGNSSRPDRSPQRSVLVRRIIVVVLCLIAANRAGVWVARQVSGTRVGSTPQVPVLLALESLDFGEIWESDAFRWPVVFQNVSDSPLTVRDLAGTCFCTKPDGSEVWLEPRQKATVEFVVDLGQLRTDAPGDRRTVEVGIQANVEQPRKEAVLMRWSLRGTVRRHLTCEPPLVSLGEELVAGESGRALLFRIRPSVPVREVRVKRVPAGWSAHVVKAPDRSVGYVLHVTGGKSKAGTFADEFEFDAVAEDGRVLPRQWVRVEGRATEPVEVLPQPLELGVVPVGTVVRASLWLSTRGGQPLVVGEVVPNDPKARVASVRQVGERWQIEIERPVTEPGHGACKGSARCRTQAAEWCEVGFSFRWYATAP